MRTVGAWGEQQQKRRVGSLAGEKSVRLVSDDDDRVMMMFTPENSPHQDSTVRPVRGVWLSRLGEFGQHKAS